MTFYKCMSRLYSSNCYIQLLQINRSIYVTDLSEDTEGQFIHTGFSFSTTTNKVFELIFDLNNSILIRQIRNSPNCLPVIAGLICIKEGKYFNRYMPQVLVEISICGEDGALSESYSSIDRTQLNTSS